MWGLAGSGDSLRAKAHKVTGEKRPKQASAGGSSAFRTLRLFDSHRPPALSATTPIFSRYVFSSLVLENTPPSGIPFCACSTFPEYIRFVAPALCIVCPRRVHAQKPGSRSPTRPSFHEPSHKNTSTPRKLHIHTQPINALRINTNFPSQTIVLIRQHG